MLRKIRAFEYWDENKVKTVAGIMTWKSATAGTILMEEGSVVKELCFIRSGKCKAFKNVKSNGVLERVDIGELGKFDYFGEEAVLLEAELGSATHRKSSYTVEAVTDIQLASFTMYDAQVKFKEDMVLSEVTELAVRPNRIIRRYNENRLKEVWDKYRDDVVKHLYDNPTEQVLPANLASRPRWKT